MSVECSIWRIFLRDQSIASIPARSHLSGPLRDLLPDLGGFGPVRMIRKPRNTLVRTLFRWLKEREFNTAYRLAKRSAFGQAIARLHYFTSAAVTTLGKVMLDPATPPATKVRAADSVLNHTIKVIEEEEIEARVSELECSADENKPGWRGRSNQ